MEESKKADAIEVLSATTEEVKEEVIAEPAKEEVAEVKEDKVETIAKEEYDKVAKEVEDLRAKVSGYDSTKVEVDKTRNDLVSKVVSALGIGEFKKPEDDIESLVEDEDKLYKHLQKTGYKGLASTLRTLAKKDAQGIVQDILTNLSANAGLYSEYPELKDEKSALSVKVSETMKAYRIPNNTDGKRIAAKMAKLELGALKVAEDVAGAVDDAKKGIQDKTDKTHVEINKKGIPSGKPVNLSADQKSMAKRLGISEESYARAYAVERDIHGRYESNIDDYKKSKEAK